MDTYRFSPHSKGDDFRSPEEIKKNKERDPINSYVISKNLNNQFLSIKNDIQNEIDAIVNALLRKNDALS
jgi:TPP-dependent pyruvate/acetoin dehydrogenase alpha subunit